MKEKIVDIIVETGNPAMLDNVLQSFGAVVVQSDPYKKIYKQQEGGYVVRCFGDVNFIEFAIHNQGYGKVLKRL